MMNKKGYFYTLDASIGVLLLIVSLVIILGFFYFAPERELTDAISHETIAILANTHMSDVCSNLNRGECSCSYPTLEAACDNGTIRNTDVSLLSLLGQLYSLEERELIGFIIHEVLIDSGVHPPQYGLRIMLTEPGSNEQAQLYPVVELNV
jgi:hypothetical protein